MASRSLGCLLTKALNVVPKTRFKYRIVTAFVTNEIGNTIPSYSAWNDAEGAIQPGLTFSFNARGVSNPIEIAKKIGLDISKNMITVFAKLDLSNIAKKETPDQIMYDGRIFNIMSISDWYEFDGWKSLICVEDTRERGV